jgi:hypothetical protein
MWHEIGLLIRNLMAWAVAERGSTNNGNKDGWPPDCSGPNTHGCTLWDVAFSGCCAETVVYSEGKKCHNLSECKHEMLFQVSVHRFGYGRAEKWPSIHIPIWGECGVSAGCSPADSANQRKDAHKSGLSRDTVCTVLKTWILGRRNTITCRVWNLKTVTTEWNMGS